MRQKATKIGNKFQGPVPTHLGGLGMALKLLPMHLRNKAEKRPKVAPGPFQTNVAAYDRPPETGLRVTWFGHSSTLLEVGAVRLLLDPMWDQRASPVRWAGPLRFFPPTLPLEQLPAIDAVLISHDHYDHLGKSTVRTLARLRPEMRWIVPLGVGAIVRGFGVRADRITEVDWTDSVDVCRVTVTALPARHFSGRGLRSRDTTLWVSYGLRGSGKTVYYGADSGLWEGFREIGQAYGPFDLVMLEIGAFNEMWKDIHMGPAGAVAALEMLGGGLLMPVHWGLFDLALHGWREPMEDLMALAASRGLQVFSPRPGDVAEVREGVDNWWRKKVSY